MRWEMQLEPGMTQRSALHMCLLCVQITCPHSRARFLTAAVLKHMVDCGSALNGCPREHATRMLIRASSNVNLESTLRTTVEELRATLSEQWRNRTSPV